MSTVRPFPAPVVIGVILGAPIAAHHVGSKLADAVRPCQASDLIHKVENEVVVLDDLAEIICRRCLDGVGFSCALCSEEEVIFLGLSL